MKQRLAPYKIAPDLMKAMGVLEAAVVAGGLEKSLIELVKTRASQINGCAFCTPRMRVRSVKPRSVFIC